jgi:hypothetical protein
VQLLFLEVLQQRAAMAMDDALGHTGGAGGEHDEQRMAERQTLEFDLGRTAGTDKIGIAHTIADVGHLRSIGEVANNHRLFDGRQLRHGLGIFFQAIDGLAVVPVAIDTDEDLRGDLAEAIQHALHAKIGRSRRPDSAQRSGSQHGDDGFRHVRQIAGNTVTLDHTGRLQRLLKARHFSVERGAGKTSLDLAFTPENHGIAGIRLLQQILGVVQARVGKPLGARHAVAVAQHSLAAFTNGAAEIPDQRPESLRVIGRPLPESIVVGKASLLHEGGHIGRSYLLGAGRPKKLIVLVHTDSSTLDLARSRSLGLHEF